MNAMNHIQRFARILTIGNGILLPAAIIIFCLDGVSGFAEMGMASIINAILGFTIPMTIGTCLLFFYARQWRQPRRHAWIGWLLSTMYNAYAMFLWWAGVALSMGISVLPIALWVTLTCALSALALMMGNPNQKVQHKVVYRSLRRNTARALLFALFAFLLYHFLSELILVPKYYSIPISISKSAYMAIGEVGLLLLSGAGLPFVVSVLLHLREWLRPSARFAFLHWFMVLLSHSSLAFILLYQQHYYALMLGIICAAMALLACIPFVMLLFQGFHRQPKETVPI